MHRPLTLLWLLAALLAVARPANALGTTVLPKDRNTSNVVSLGRTLEGGRREMLRTDASCPPCRIRLPPVCLDSAALSCGTRRNPVPTVGLEFPAPLRSQAIPSMYAFGRSLRTSCLGTTTPSGQTAGLRRLISCATSLWTARTSTASTRAISTTYSAWWASRQSTCRRSPRPVRGVPDGSPLRSTGS